MDCAQFMASGWPSHSKATRTTSYPLPDVRTGGATMTFTPVARTGDWSVAVPGPAAGNADTVATTYGESRCYPDVSAAMGGQR
jgi:hypothetical protein